MGIKYFIFNTRLQDTTQSFGRVILKGTIYQAALIDRMLDKGTSLTRPDITAVLQLLSMSIETACSEGYKVNIDGLIQVTPVIGGQFTDKSDTFLTPRNTLYLTSQVSKSLNDRVARNATVEKVIVDESRPVLLDVVDSEADEGITTLAMGHITSVNGKRLKFDAAQPKEYLRLVNAQNPNEFLPVTKFHKVSDQELVFRLPQATFQEGYFELASSLNTNTIRIGRSESFLMAA